MQLLPLKSHTKTQTSKPSSAARLTALFAAIVALCLSGNQLWAQGCVIAHSVGQVAGPENNGGYLSPGHFQLTLDYRHLYSFRHYVGTVEQVYRLQGNSEVRNRIKNLEEGTQAWELEYKRAMDQIKRKHGLE